MTDFPVLIDVSILGSDGFKIQGTGGARNSIFPALDVNADGFADIVTRSAGSSSINGSEA